MPICFAAAVSHAPGITAWAEAAPEEQKNRLVAAYDETRKQLDASGAEVLVLLTSEHWANFFLDHMGAFCLGRAENYEGPIEPWLRVKNQNIRGHLQLGEEILTHCYENEFELSFAHEVKFDHGTMVPLHFLTPKMNYPVVPLFFNTLAPPRPSPSRCLALGRILSEVLNKSELKIGVIATGGLSHDPAELNHGVIDTEFDQTFLSLITAGNLEALEKYTDADLSEAGAGTLEILAWFALAGILGGSTGKVLSYEPVKQWATGMTVVQFNLAA